MNHDQTNDFLLEIGTEELPPKQINILATALAKNLKENLQELSLVHGEVKTFSSPRRLAVLISNLKSKQEDQPIEIRGPSVKIAFDPTGNPTIAAIKFAATCGIAVEDLKRIEDKKGAVLFYKTIRAGRKTIDLLPEAITHSIKKLPIKRAMRWGENLGPFVRPLHWIVALFGAKTIDLEIFGVKASNKTFGHRFHCPQELLVSEPSEHENLLKEKGFVIADSFKRQQEIRQQITSLTIDDVAIIPEDLLDEVTNLVEWPVALMGVFNERFLKIPKEALITTLKNHQRCFPICDESGELLPRFVMISNIKSSLPTQVIEGNERVIQARFTDAQYFYQKDLKQDLINNLDSLKSVTFQDGLGSLYDKTQRLKTIASFIATKIDIDITTVERASELSKCDLVTSMVREFPELQGIMGYYYALKNENLVIAAAIKEQYLPAFSQDKIPSTKAGAALALADRIDNLIGLFAINKIPTSDKDPFSLRRAANGILRIILEKNLELDLKEIIEKSCLTYKDIIKNKDEIVAKALDFIYE
ncbi:MAG: glycine--tRNA ligase subunit beta, partial [Gammaproteobacteria bacterium]|nr:glycine--tRNA ligase subunit beta [Gammaproteobacteria bacterium]